MLKLERGHNLAPSIAALSALSADCAVDTVEPLFAQPRGKAAAQLLGSYRLRLRSASCRVEAAVETLRRLPGVVYAHRQYMVHAAATLPDDPGFPNQWHLDAAALPAAVDIDAPEAWDLETGNNGIVVAVLDTGVDYNHEDLVDPPRSNLWSNVGETSCTDGIDNDGNGYRDDCRGYNFADRTSDPMDDNGHGTAVAGVIAALGNNGRGVAGVCWAAAIMPVKVLGRSGTGRFSDVAEGIVYATDMGARVVNLSLGGEDAPGPDPMEDAVAYATANGVLLVASAGNAGFYRIQYPAGYRPVLAVGALSRSLPNQRAPFSSYGANLDLVAPGDKIDTLGRGNSYVTLSGTSLSAPIVSGVAALLLAQTPSLTAAEVESVLKDTAEDLGMPGYDQSYGYGKVNAYRALTHAAASRQAFLAEIDSPFQNETLGRYAIAVRGTADSGALTDWTLEWGAGPAPAVWNPIAAGLTRRQQEALGSFDASGLPRGDYTLRLTVRDAARGAREARLALQIENLLNDRNPIPLPYTVGGGGQARPGFSAWFTDQDPVVADLDGDGRLEVVVPGSSFIKAFALDGSLVPGWDKTLPSLTVSGYDDWVEGSLAAAEIEGRGRGLRIVAMTGGLWPSSLRVYDRDGSEPAPWPLPVSDGVNPFYGAGPSLADLDGGGDSEIVVVASAEHVGQSVFAYRSDGTFASGWPVAMTPDPNTGALLGGPNVCLADLDGDGSMDLLANNYVYEPATPDFINDDLWAFDARGQVMFRNTGGAFDNNSPIAGNVDADPGFEYVVNSWTYNPVSQGVTHTVKCREGDGSLKWSYGSLLGLERGPAMGYLGPGLGLGIAIHDVSQETVSLLRADGTLYPGWPFVLGSSGPGGSDFVRVSSSMSLADIDGDGNVELLFSSTFPIEQWGNNPAPNYNCRLWAIHHDGTLVQGFPKVLNGVNVNAPIVTDVDGDGNADIVVQTADFVYIFATGARYGAKPWPMYQHDLARTGRYEPCGDGIVTTAIGEQCDDGNTVDGDGCSSTCRIERALLRNTDVARLDPVQPPLASILPLDAVRDAYILNFRSGDFDPDLAAGHPLVFYGLASPDTLRLTKTAAGPVRVWF